MSELRLAFKSAFPDHCESCGCPNPAGGMTYREWLVGQIAAGATSLLTTFIHDVEPRRSADTYRQRVATEMVALADAIIKELEPT